ncbi:hypothetical protein PsAD2_02976 [Pseudovibrio axinellae]|uniref:Nucleoside 2-deoxyribosyltransferase n=1 Tax=Pseudovibrio axinellae TaxID=989403 RepID=A0A165XEV1_9HYPH|nr:hypothetical protein [Pseudovibrio axinellae]KZL17640.1 hypothetical protein PsAD2_02976 [Pseudovibrio axinellae]SER45314.1 hypothetical protein SAMN05421798_110106 [Pseudovibrio axinellae]
MARILIAPTTSKSVKDKLSKLLRDENHAVIDSNKNALDWSDVDPAYSNWTPQEAMSSLLEDTAVKSAYADLERDMRSADACLLFFPASQDAALMAGWFVAHQKNVVGVVSGNGNLPTLAFMTTDLCLNVDEVVEAFSGR